MSDHHSNTINQTLRDHNLADPSKLLESVATAAVNWTFLAPPLRFNQTLVSTVEPRRHWRDVARDKPADVGTHHFRVPQEALINIFHLFERSGSAELFNTHPEDHKLDF
jgi:hypothetical protein